MSWVSERTQPFFVEQLGAIAHVAVRFKPGGIRAFMRVPASEFTDDVVDVHGLLDQNPRELEERLADAPSEAARVRLLEDFLRRRLQPPNARDSLARVATQLFARTHGSMSLAELCQQLDCDYKQLERSFLSVVGVRPKFFGRLMRFVGVLEALKSSPPESWTRIGLEFGYYDQAHFIREFKRFTASTPSQFRVGPDSITDMLARSLDRAAVGVEFVQDGLL